MIRTWDFLDEVADIWSDNPHSIEFGDGEYWTRIEIPSRHTVNVAQHERVNMHTAEYHQMDRQEQRVHPKSPR